MMKFFLSFVLLPLHSAFHSSHAAKLPNSFKKCARSNPKFDECLNDAIEGAVRTLSTGVPKLGLLALEPLSVTQLNIGRGKGPISLDLKFKNLKIHGITDVKIMDQKTNLKEGRLQCKTLNKKLVLDGDYEVEGKILLLPIRGKGKANIILDNVEGKILINGVTQQKKGKSFLEVKSFDYTFKPSRMRLQLDNLFNGEKHLSDAMNKILNDNWEEVLRELNPSFEEALSEIFKEYANRLYQRVALEDIYPISEQVS